MIAGLLYATQAQAQGLTYWEDSSCNGKIDTVVEEAIEMHSWANTRMTATAADTNQDTAFSLLFKQPKTDLPTFNEVQRVESGLGEFTISNDRANSNLRIYCDDDEFGGQNRWQPVPNDPTLPSGATQNSQRTYGVDQEVYDPLNGIRMPLTLNVKPGCKDPDTEAETFDLLHTAVTGQTQNRATLTVGTIAIFSEHLTKAILNKICNDGLSSPTKSLSASLPLKKNIADLATNSPAGRTLNAFNTMVSFVVAHELTHITTYGKDDVFGYPNSYGWTHVEDTTIFNNQDSLKNADNYAYFGLIAKLADRKFRLALPTAQAQSGNLVHDNPIPQKAKRSASMIVQMERWLLSAPLARRFDCGRGITGTPTEGDLLRLQELLRDFSTY